MTVNTPQQQPPPPINPKNSKKLKLLDIDSLELARQLTILESRLYQKIRPMECLVRSREQKTDHNDNIAAVIHTSNRVCSRLDFGVTILLTPLFRLRIGLQTPC